MDLILTFASIHEALKAEKALLPPRGARRSPRGELVPCRPRSRATAASGSSHAVDEGRYSEALRESGIAIEGIVSNVESGGRKAMSGSFRTIDARGLACPQPVVLAKKALEEGGFDLLEMIVDGPSARENVTRFASYAGHAVEEVKEAEGGDDDMHSPAPGSLRRGARGAERRPWRRRNPKRRTTRTRA